MKMNDLEEVLDTLFSEQMSSRHFLGECIKEFLHRSTENDPAFEFERLKAELSSLHRKRKRVVDIFVEGHIDEPEMAKRLAPIDEGIRVTSAALGRREKLPAPDFEKLIETYSPLAERGFWTRDQKRRFLSTLTPDIRVADYEVESLGLNPALVSKEDTRSDKGSWPRPT